MVLEIPYVIYLNLSRTQQGGTFSGWNNTGSLCLSFTIGYIFINIKHLSVIQPRTEASMQSVSAQLLTVPNREVINKAVVIKKV